jgi:phosphoserine phosphatase RsbU/P
VEAAGQPGTPAGLFDDPLVSDVEVDLGAGDAIVLYTDGVTERHEGTRIFGEERLRRVLRECAGFTADQIAGHIEDAVVGFQPGPLRDDMAVLVVRIAP